MEHAKLLPSVVAAVREAGRSLREEFHRTGGPRGGGHHADIDEPVERRLRERLLEAFACACLGEECGSTSGREPGHVWLVDPHDGTRAFLKGYRGSSVSVALLQGSTPVLGVVYAFAYPDDEGDLLAWAEGGGPIERNGRPIDNDLRRVDLRSNPPPLALVSEEAESSVEANLACVAPLRFVALPSIAYRLALVAAGEAVVATSLGGPRSWDVAAGHALVRAAGGVLRTNPRASKRGTCDLAEVVYDAHGHATMGDCFGGASAAVDLLAQRDWRAVFAKTPSQASAAWRPRPLARGHAVTDRGRLARAQGCLLGQLAGDSLGGLVEFESAERIAARHPGGVRRLVDGGCWGILAGQPTDDSEMALMLARGLARLGRYDAATALEGYVHWIESRPFDVGSTTRQALAAAAQGASAAERLERAQRHASRQSQANGSLMRASPLGIFGAGRPGEAAEWARADSRLTHPHPICQESCAAFVAAVATAIAGSGEPGACYQAALEEARRGDQAAVVETLEAAARRPPQDYQGQMGWVLVALQNAFYQLLHAPTFEEGVVDTVMRGGDTDTNAAITGALLGAVYGRGAVPAPWVCSLLSCRPTVSSGSGQPRPEEYWTVDALVLAERLLSAPA